MSLESVGYRGALRPQEIHRDRQTETVKPVSESRGDERKVRDTDAEGLMLLATTDKQRGGAADPLHLHNIASNQLR